jgi:hypothetical protein
VSFVGPSSTVLERIARPVGEKVINVSSRDEIKHLLYGYWSLINRANICPEAP